MITGLPRKSFVCEETFRIESKQIMSQHWIAAATMNELAEASPDRQPWLKIDIGDYSVIVVRKSDDSIAAFHNVCRHRGTRLIDSATGELKNDCLTCPYHAWSYNTEGELIGAPNMSDVGQFDRTDFSLFPVACDVWAGIIFLNLGDSTASFREDLRPLISRLQNWNVDSLEIIKTLDYTVNANWKLIFQNYSECYHCPTVHPELNRQTPYKTAENDLEAGPILGGPMQLSDGVETVSSDGKHVGEPFEGLNESQRRSIHYYTVFPNMFVSAHPDYVMIHQLTPLSPHATRVSCHFLSGNYATVYSLDRAWNMWDTVNQQDWRVCELTQSGVNSPAFQPGPYSNLESMLAAFDQHYRSVMNMNENMND